MYSSNSEKIKAIFNVITYSYPLKRIEYLSELLKYNQDINLIKALTLIPSGKSGNGSFVPLWEEEKRFWQSVEKICSGNIKLLRLKLWAKDQQNICDRYIELELKREFVNEY